MIEIIDAPELAKRWRVPESWIRSKVRTRTASSEQIPHASLGRYCRFIWGSPELQAWFDAHMRGGSFANQKSRPLARTANT